MADDANNWEYGTNTQEITSTENLSSAVIGENGFFMNFLDPIGVNYLKVVYIKRQLLLR